MLRLTPEKSSLAGAELAGAALAGAALAGAALAGAAVGALELEVALQAARKAAPPASRVPRSTCRRESWRVANSDAVRGMSAMASTSSSWRGPVARTWRDEIAIFASAR